MKINGIEEEGHKIFAEIDRNRGFIKKIKEAETGIDESMATQAVGGDPQKRLKLDTAAAMRMAKPYLASSRATDEPLANSRVPVLVGLPRWSKERSGR